MNNLGAMYEKGLGVKQDSKGLNTGMPRLRKPRKRRCTWPGLSIEI